MFQNLISKIKDKQIILFGEIHGTKEIPELLSKFFEEVSQKENFNLCLEIPDEFQEQMDHYMRNGNFETLTSIPFFSKENCTDGRNSLEYLNLIKEIYKINKNKKEKMEVFCIFPSKAESQEEVEKGLADRILEIAKNKKTFAILGGIHASKNKINLFGQKITPAGFLINQTIKEKSYSILFRPKSGKFFNNGVKEVYYSTNDPFDNNFDYIYLLDKVSSCSFL